VFTWIVRVKVELFTANFLGGAKLFTVGCGEWFRRLPLPPMNNFGGTIRAALLRRPRIQGRAAALPYQQGEEFRRAPLIPHPIPILLHFPFDKRRLKAKLITLWQVLLA
jgi:hypothetical protein